jgi:hypothetical protein
MDNLRDELLKRGKAIGKAAGIELTWSDNGREVAAWDIELPSRPVKRSLRRFESPALFLDGLGLLEGAVRPGVLGFSAEWLYEYVVTVAGVTGGSTRFVGDASHLGTSSITFENCHACGGTTGPAKSIVEWARAPGGAPNQVYHVLLCDVIEVAPAQRQTCVKHSTYFDIPNYAEGCPSCGCAEACTNCGQLKPCQCDVERARLDALGAGASAPARVYLGQDS